MLREAIPEQDAVNLQHLRRFAKTDYLPYHLRLPSPSAAENIGNREEQKQNYEGDYQPRQAGTLPPQAEPTFEPSLHLLVCAASIITSSDLVSILSNRPPFSDAKDRPSVRTVSVPLLPPTSDKQATAWSRQYWPTVYKRNNPFGPHPSFVSRAEVEIQPQIDEYMALAAQVGREAKTSSLGEPVGAIIVDRNANAGSVVLVIAGDGRWGVNGQREHLNRGNGNVMAHAVMRAIGMVARRRRETAVTMPRGASPTDVLKPAESAYSRDSVFLDWPLGDLENDYYTACPVNPTGYLCVDMEIYVTHEPCVMCCMAINHARFGRVVFRKRMPQTGALTSEPMAAMPCPVREQKIAGHSEDYGSQSMGYGLFWRPGLNWKLLAWQWVATLNGENNVAENIHA